MQVVPYPVLRVTSANIHPWVGDFESKVIRGQACFEAALQLKASGFTPQVIVAHHDWGESLFLKEVWSQAQLGIYCEFHHQPGGINAGFDAEFANADPVDACRIRLKNTNNLLHFETADAGLSPTHWQASTFPEAFRRRITVIHDGMDTQAVVPNPAVSLTLNGTLALTRKDEVITFINRNLEPCRGYHIFMRALPEIFKRRPNARVLIVGGNDVSYGTRPQDGQTWKDIFANEVRSGISAADWSRVHFLGTVAYAHCLALLQLPTVHVYLTYPLVLSWSLLEAMSTGCAIVASNTAPLKEAMVQGQTGRLVNFFDAHGLAAEVCNLLDDPLQRQRLGAQARAFARVNYDLKAVCLPRQLAWVEALQPA